MIKRFVFSFLMVLSVHDVVGQGMFTGVVKDAQTSEAIYACNFIFQGTTIAGVTDFNGAFSVKGIPAGTYNVIFSFISYEKQIQKVTITKGDVTELNVYLKTAPNANQFNDVFVTASRRTDTELSMLTNNKSNLLTVSGISSQQIAKSLDKDASEVIRRIPGVSIRDGKFIIVRGLTERYNTVWLNGSITPSSESDVRAFSFDVIPSGQIDNILIYKTPAPELPADFAGAMINIKTKSLIDKNSITLSYSYGNHQGTTGKDFYTYQGGKTDWLGIEDGTRGIPSTVPTTEEYKKLFDQITPDKITQINTISKSFNTIMTPYKNIAKPDADAQLTLNYRFRLSNISIGTITALGYNATNTNENTYKAAYWAYPDTSYRFMQHSFTSKVRLNALSNWTFTFGNNQKIEFRNLLNNYGMTKTVLKEGFDFYLQSNERSYELGYESRTTYSGQLAGNHAFNSDRIKLDWVLGYSYADKKQPDIRRVKTNAFDTEIGTQYMFNLSGQVSPDALGRMTLNNEENIVNGGLNYSQKLRIGSFMPEIKAGAYYEKKQRNFNSRVFGYMKSGASNMYAYQVESYNGTAGFDDAMFTSISNAFNSKIDYKTGMILSESTQKADSYTAQNELEAGYFAVNLPVTKWFKAYIGIRLENNNLTLNGFERDGTDKNPIERNVDSLNFFPSINATVNITDKLLMRFASGKTINRPEFREVSPFAFYNFEDNAVTYGNPDLKNCYVSNSDVRLEWYPTSEELISIGAFYKDFTNPIESKILITGSGWNYTFHNAEKAKSYGVELEVRKRLYEFVIVSGLEFLSNLSLVMNGSFIKSVVNTDSITEGATERSLQGQSPFIINVGAYYNDTKSRFMASIMYNKTGERIATVGNIDVPHIIERPFNSLDFTIEKGVTKWATIKFGIKNILDDNVVFQQYQKYTDKGENKTRTQVNTMYKPGRQFKLGISLNL